MGSKQRELQSFLFSQYFSDGLRISLGVLLPSLILAYFYDHFELGITASLGALCVSISDSPGPESHRRNGMGLCLLSMVLVFLITGFAQISPVLMGLEILLFSFFFSMFNIYGNRAAAIGTSALLVMILSMDQHLDFEQVLIHGLLILGGGLWYMFLSMVFYQIRPYRPAQQVLGDCIREVAKFLRIKAEFYQSQSSLEEGFRKVINQQVIVTEKQDSAREILLKSRQIVKENTNTGRILVLTFVDLMDLYEQITTIHYDYSSIRERYEHTGVLEDIAQLISLSADELDKIGLAIQSNLRHKREMDLTEQLEQLRLKVDEVGSNDQEASNLVLKKIVVNLRNLIQRIQDMASYFDAPTEVTRKKRKEVEYNKFVTHQVYDPKLLLNNLTFNSSVFRYSFRVAVVCLVGYIITELIPYGHHSYWVLLTIIVILKPGFSLTKQRNYQRLVGTVAGGALGLLILMFIQDKIAHFVLLLIFMVLTYSLQRMNYIWSVFFMTPFVLLLFSFLGSQSFSIVQERVLDTLLGSAIAFGASYLIFPTWEYQQINKYMQELVKANLDYLQKLTDRLAGKDSGVEEYKLTRKAVYISSANMAAAFQRMTSEPKSKQRNSKEVYEFVVLNHILSSLVSTVFTSFETKEAPAVSRVFLRPARRALTALQEAATKLGVSFSTVDTSTNEGELTDKASLTPDEQLLKEQLEFLQKISGDIIKVTESIKV